MVKQNLSAGTELLLPVEDFKKKLESGKKLVIKLGMDPTAPDLHLGHTIVLSKLKQFQDAGHEIVFIIGDFTARVGDPSGKSKTRPQLEIGEIVSNAKTYMEQVGRVLDIKKVKIRYNSEWLSKLSFADFLKIAGKVTLARIIEREDFQNRLAENQPIGFHELFYPLMQAYDSVVLKADVEIGGTDQTFNLLMGRHLQEHYSQEPQVVLTMPILAGLDGVKKMSKSLGNYVGLKEPASMAFGKLMSISDDLMWRYFELLVGSTKEEIEVLRNKVTSGTIHPMELKKEMAHKIIARFWSESEASEAQHNFEALFQQKDYSQAKEVKIPGDLQSPVWIVDLLKTLGAISGSSEAKRLIESGAIEIDGSEVKDFKLNVNLKSGMIIKVGKLRIFKITI
jgi:tyrosyl-tRNA synthetase